jgi:hypothetical protein
LPIAREFSGVALIGLDQFYLWIRGLTYGSSGSHDFSPKPIVLASPLTTRGLSEVVQDYVVSLHRDAPACI